MKALRLFQALNRERLHHLFALAPSQHALILDCLPLFFHLNTPTLPGYIDDKTPAGLLDYHPSTQTLDKAKQLDRRFSSRNRALRRYPLRGLYLLKPHGYISYADQAEFSLWLLYSDQLTNEQIDSLKQKSSAIQQWAREHQLILDIRLIAEQHLHDSSALSNFDRESFYCNGIVMAGYQPSWWQDDDTSTTSNQRSIDSIDFGDSQAIIDTDFINASCHHLRQFLLNGIVSIELFYFPFLLQGTIKPVSFMLKQAISDEQQGFLALDSDYLMLKALEPASTTVTLNLAREIYYRSAGERLSQQVRQSRHPWRRAFVQHCINQWQWSEMRIKQLDSKDSFQAERNFYNAIRPHCLAFINALQAYCKQESTLTTSAISELKQLYAYRFQPALNQISVLPKAVRPNSIGEPLYLYRFQDRSDWLVSKQALMVNATQGLFQHHQLLHVLAWAINNGLLGPSNHLSVTDQHQKLTTHDVTEIVHDLLSAGIDNADLTPYPMGMAHKEELVRSLLFINLEQQPSNKLTQQGLQLSSKQNDPLNYSSFNESLIVTIESLHYSSYGIWYCDDTYLEQPVMDFLTAFLLWQPKQSLQIKAHCFTPIFADKISHRLEVVVQELLSHYQQFPSHGRFIISIAGKPYQLQWHDGQVDYIPLMQEVISQQIFTHDEPFFSALAIDRSVDKDGLLALILQQQRAHQICITLVAKADHIVCFCIDEKGNVCMLTVSKMQASRLIQHLKSFLAELPSQSRTRFFILKATSRELMPVTVHNVNQSEPPFQVMLSHPSKQASLSIRINGQTFSGSLADTDFLLQIQRSLQIDTAMPVHITKLQFEDGNHHPTTTYLMYKQLIEQRFRQD
ncbi:MAG TPA: hypothetical protein ENH61_00560 [Methylophaga aminisulfidivorans]|nr:hypothetical protein [Methylophaga aminisulfidivorans]